jgi:hypothetical protein
MIYEFLDFVSQKAKPGERSQKKTRRGGQPGRPLLKWFPADLPIKSAHCEETPRGVQCGKLLLGRL